MTTKNLQLNPTGYTLVSAIAYGFLENTTGYNCSYIDTIRAYLVGVITITGGTGLSASLLEF